VLLKLPGMNVNELMTKAVVVVTPQDNLRTALRLLDECDIRHLPVVEGQKIVGMLSDRDLRRYRLPPHERFGHPAYAEALLDTPVSEAMRTDLLYCYETDTLSTAVDKMIEYEIGALPVVTDGTKQLLGILSYVDVLKGRRKRLSSRGADAA
jgi:acetoin utilization protein AcuB